MRALVIAAVAAFVLAFAGAGAVVAAANHEAAGSAGSRALRSDVHTAAATSPSPKASADDRDEAGVQSEANKQSDADEQSGDADEDDGGSNKSKAGRHQEGDGQRGGAAGSGDVEKRD